ncbi:MAG: hypothetical protein M0Z28_12760 [Rhodospirillales bacterium]|nr:hypothetical protein [Rhodospirillales bacterium]
MTIDRLRPGDRVALRSPAEILSTLDAGGTLGGVPFMPEMLQNYGRVLTVAKRVEKICDTISPVASRRMADVVFLDDLRCDGGGHGGCQAACRIYWKDAWLARMAPNALPPRRPDPAALAALARAAEANARQPDNPDLYRCQATEARRATTALAGWDVRQYAREAQSGNITWGRLARLFLVRILPWELRSLLRRPAAGLPRPRRMAGTPKSVPLNLQPGEWVEVRSAAEIARTLDAKNTNRGLYFSAPEMATECGKRFRVRRRLSRIIEESSGRMLIFRNDCIELEGPVCTGERSIGRWFCAREIYPYWREAWLKRVPVAAQPNRPTTGEEETSASLVITSS